MSNARIRSALPLLFFCGMVGACGDDEAVADDPLTAAVAEQMQESGAGTSPEEVASSVAFVRNCLVILDAVERVDEGGEFVNADVASLVEEVREDPDTAGTAELFQGLIDSAELGDLSAARAFVESQGGCADYADVVDSG